MSRRKPLHEYHPHDKGKSRNRSLEPDHISPWNPGVSAPKLFPRRSNREHTSGGWEPDNSVLGGRSRKMRARHQVTNGIEDASPDP
ncbi:hypothetical protein Dimus_038754 [Dionaea muscipula]